MMKDCKDNIMTVNDQVVLAVLPTQKCHGVEGHLKLWAGPKEGATYWLCLAVPFELDSDEMASRALFWLWEGVRGGWGWCDEVCGVEVLGSVGWEDVRSVWVRCL